MAHEKSYLSCVFCYVTQFYTFTWNYVNSSYLQARKLRITEISYLSYFTQIVQLEPWLRLFQSSLSFIHSKLSWIMYVKLISALIFVVLSALASYSTPAVFFLFLSFSLFLPLFLIFSFPPFFSSPLSLSPLHLKFPLMILRLGALHSCLVLLVYLTWISPGF